MKIFIICSKQFYPKIPDIQSILEKQGHRLAFPNTYPDTTQEQKYRALGRVEHSRWKAALIKHSAEVISQNDTVLVLNFEKNGLKNYIGGATFLEMYEAFRLNKKIFLYNDIPDGMLYDEINAFNPTILHGDLNLLSDGKIV